MSAPHSHVAELKTDWGAIDLDADTLSAYHFLVAEPGAAESQIFGFHDLVNAVVAGALSSNALVHCAVITGPQWLPLHSIKPLAAATGLSYERHSDGPKVAQWYFATKSHGSGGPVTFEVLKSMVGTALSMTDDSSLVWTASMAAWTPARQCEPLIRAIQSTSTSTNHEVPNINTDGNGASTTTTATMTSSVAPSNPSKKRRKGVNSSVYVASLPSDVTVDELATFMKKGGVIKEDLYTGTKCVKLYQHCDALVTYLFPESVQLAIDLLDGAEIRPGHGVSVSEAQFSEPNKAEKSSAPAKKHTKLEAVLARQQKQSATSWVGDDDEAVSNTVSVIESDDGSSDGVRIVTLKHTFALGDIDASVADSDEFFAELTSDIGGELESKCGPIKDMTVFEYHPDGIINVKFLSTEAAHRCLTLMQGRYFNGRQLVVSYWDGTDYAVREDEESERRRLKRFGEALDQGEI